MNLFLIGSLTFYALYLYDRSFERQQTHQSVVRSKDTGNHKIAHEIVKEDLEKVKEDLEKIKEDVEKVKEDYTELLPTVRFRELRDITLIILVLYLTLARIVSVFNARITVQEHRDINEETNVTEEFNTNMTQTPYRYLTKLFCLLINYISFKKCLLLIILIAFLLSIPVEYDRLLQIETAKKDTVLRKGVPIECSPKYMTIAERFSNWMGSKFLWRHDPCEVYNEAFIVDPSKEINLFMAVTSLLTRCLVHSMELLSDGIGKSLGLFFKHIPAQWQLGIMIVIFFVLSNIALILLIYSPKKVLVPNRERYEFETIQHERRSTTTTVPANNHIQH